MAAFDLLADYLNADLSSSDEEPNNNLDDEDPADNFNADDYKVESDEEDENLDEMDIVERPYPQNDVLMNSIDLEIFGNIQSTMITIAGRVRNFKYHEALLTRILNPSGDIICIKSNFGCKPPEYDEPKEEAKVTTRGRKKKEKNKKPRAIQGSGKCFNSQTTFITKSMHLGKKYQFKIFRNGKIQLPGAKPGLYADIYDKLTGIIDMLNAKLKKPNEPQIELVRFAPSMKNYRFDLLKGNTQLIDLYELSNILNEEWLDDRVIKWADDYDDQFIEHNDDMEIKYLSVDYTRQDTRLSLQFSTPLPDRPDKCARVNVFMKGVIKILGSLHDSVTVAIIRYLRQIILDHPELIIDEEIDETDENNIISTEINQQIFEETLDLLCPSVLNKINITDEDEADFQRLLDEYDGGN